MSVHTPAAAPLMVIKAPPKKAFLTEGRVSQQEVMLFCRQLATFVHVGIPITTAIRTFGEESGSKMLRKACVAMAQDVERGSLLSDAIQQHPNVFPALVSDMVRAAELTGNLDVVLRQASKAIEREASAKQKIKAAMIYPCIVSVMALVISIGMVLFVLPEFADLYASLNVPLPGLVRFLLGTSAFVGHHWPLMLLGLALVATGLAGSLRTERGRFISDRMVLHVPLVGAMQRTAISERFCRTLGDMLGAGVPISQGFAVVTTSTRNLVYRRGLRMVATGMAAGEGFAHPIRKTGLFKAMVTQMVAVGEETGSLEMQLREAADLLGDELDFQIKRMTSIIEPALIVAVGLMVGFVAVSMVTAIYSLAGGFK